MIRLGILASGRGTAFFPIQEAISQQKLAAKIEIIISNKPDAPIIFRAKKLDLEAQVIDYKGKSPEECDRQLSDLLKKHHVDLIILIGFMRILSEEFVTLWQNKIINIHPSLLPLHAGKMDLAVHQAVLDAKEKISGCTVHYVTPMVDAGPIVLQKQCIVEENDTAETLKARVQQLEGEALIAAIKKINLTKK